MLRFDSKELQLSQSSCSLAILACYKIVGCMGTSDFCSDAPSAASPARPGECSHTMGVQHAGLGHAQTVQLCTGCPGDSANCSGDCPWRSPSSVHHHRPNLGRCDVAGSGRHHCTINANFGVPFALPHCAAPSRHQHVDAVNPAAPSQRPASPSSRRAALSSAVPPHCCPVHSLSVPDGRSGVWRHSLLSCV